MQKNSFLQKINLIYQEVKFLYLGRNPLISRIKQILDELGCKEILGISDKAHISRHWYSRAFKHAAYDTIWAEHGGKLQNNGFFRYPLTLLSVRMLTLRPRNALFIAGDMSSSMN